METGGRVNPLPFAKCAHDLVDLTLLVLEALAGIYVWNMDNGFQIWVQHLGDRIHIPPGVEKITNIQRLEPAVTVELLVVRVRNSLKLALFRRGQHGLAVSTEVGAGHGNQVHLVAVDERAQLASQFVVGVGGNVVELVDGYQAVVEGFEAQLFHGKAEGGMRADQHLVAAIQEGAHCVHLGLGHTRLINAWGIA
ncbi:hypothetical protein D3C87_1322820 [compost metagenome]